jgi:hypothetical protein
VVDGPPGAGLQDHRRLRRDSGTGIRNVCRQFVVLCRELELFSQATVAIDGSKFKAVNSRERNYTAGKLDRRQREIETNIQRYLDAMDIADRTMPEDWLIKTARLGVKIDELHRKMKDLRRVREQLQSTPDGQISLTDPDARAMTTHSNTGTAIVGYNVQAAVDIEHRLVVAHDVTNLGHDRTQLSRMAHAAREAMGKKRLEALADRGYYSGPELKKCEDDGIAALVSKPMTSSSKADGDAAGARPVDVTDPSADIAVDQERTPEAPLVSILSAISMSLRQPIARREGALPCAAHRARSGPSTSDWSHRQSTRWPAPSRRWCRRSQPRPTG